MSIRTVLLTVLALGLLALGSIWLTRPQQVASPLPPEARRPELEPTARSESLALSNSAERAPATANSSPAVWTPSTEDLIGAQWVEGRVLLPPGVPAEDSITLEAHGKAFRGGGRHSVVLGPDGAFRLAFPEDCKTGALHLAARFLYLDDMKLKLPCVDGPLELQPELRGVLKGRIVLGPIARHASEPAEQVLE